jgi:hypothetical protein
MGRFRNFRRRTSFKIRNRYRKRGTGLGRGATVSSSFGRDQRRAYQKKYRSNPRGSARVMAKRRF